MLCALWKPTTWRLVALISVAGLVIVHLRVNLSDRDVTINAAATDGFLETASGQHSSGYVRGQCQQAKLADMLTWSPIMQLMASERGYQTDTEDSLTRSDASPKAIFDPIVCEEAAASFAGLSSSQLRDGGISSKSGESNRKRQLVVQALHAVSSMVQAGQMEGPSDLTCVSELDGMKLSVYLTETYSGLYDSFKKLVLARFESSEYMPGQRRSGVFVGGKRHEDLQASSFANDSFDLLLSTEVWEHLPFPYKAHAEAFRILKPGGAHVFTVPFIPRQERDIVMSKMLPDGTIKHGPGSPPGLTAPWYHLDPLRPEGILAFTVFGAEMVVKLCQMGFDVDTQQMWDPKFGIFGDNAIVFTAWKARAVPQIVPEPEQILPHD